VIRLAYKLSRPYFFSMDAETAHKRVMSFAHNWPKLTNALWLGGAPPKSAACSFLGLDVPSPVGMAAGMDKEGEALLLWERLGFGHLEVGTVTPRPQQGNPKPRIFRIPKDKTVVNAMGFPSSGVEEVRNRLLAQREKGAWPSIPVGFNIGKNKTTPLEEAAQDYKLAASSLRALADFFTINVSSPNTPNLRKLQDPKAILPILDEVIKVADGLPVLLKISPDIDSEVLVQTVDVAMSAGVKGIVATNTTIRRPTLASKDFETGGLSGAPLFDICRPVIESVIEAVAGRGEVIGVGGISSPERANTLLNMGCSSVQLFSGMVFEGPGLINQINKNLSITP
jgi:dihydroorotate dehydrogenase